jgi:hypothetical protein
MKLWISNLPPNKSDEEIRAFVRKYTQVEIEAMTRIDGDGSSPGVLIEIDGATRLMLSAMQTRMNRMYWDQHEINVHIMSFSDQG